MRICNQQESAMRKSRLGMFAMLVIAMCTTACVAQEKKPLSPPGQASVKFDDGKTVTIQYSRPSMRGRKIFGGLVPYDQVWRTGANSATSLETDVDLTDRSEEHTSELQSLRHLVC